MRTTRRRRDDRGGVELFVLVVVLALLAGLSLVVDGGGYLRAQDEAAWCARQASRAATHRLDMVQARTDGTPVVVGPDAIETAERMVAASEMTGTAVVNTDGSVTVSCTAEYKPIVLTVLGKTTWHATGQGTARPVHGVTEPQEP